MGPSSKHILGLVLGGCAMAMPASGDIVYGNFSGDTVDYLNVREDDDPKPLFGEPTISGDSLNFTPLDFEAESNGGGIDFVDGTLAFTIMPTNGQGVSTLTLEESGGFALAGIGTNVTRVEVGAVISVNVLEVDGNAFAGNSQVSLGATLFEADLISDPGLAQSWTGAVTLDIANAAATELSINGLITKASVVIDNQLLAISEDGSISFIDKKQIDAVTVTVPEPTSFVLVGLGSLYLLRRRSA
jgi:hypothetical protein